MSPRSSFIDVVREGDGSSTSAGKDLPAGVSRAAALKQLLDMHEEPDPTRDVPAHRFWTKIMRRTAAAALLIGVCSFRAEAQTIKFTSSTPPLTPQQAADVLRPHQYVAPPTLPDGPHVYIIGSTPGAAYWMPFPPEAPRRRLDGTLLDSRPPDHYWTPTPAVVVTHHSRR